MAELSYAANEDAYGTFANGGLELERVLSSSAIYQLGFRTDDVLLEMNNLPLSDIDEVDAAILAAVADDEFDVELKQMGSAGWQYLTYEYVIQ